MLLFIAACGPSGPPPTLTQNTLGLSVSAMAFSRLVRGR